MTVLSLNRRQLSYHVFGRGTPILFIPPPVVGSAVFVRQAAVLAQKFKVILFELPGHGRSGGTGGQLTYPRIVDDVCDVLNQLEIDRCIVSGYSMGASVVLEFARRCPERIMAGVLISGFSEVSDIRLQSEISMGSTVARLNMLTPLATTLAFANADNQHSFRQMVRMGKRANALDVQSMFDYALRYNCTENLEDIYTPMQLVFGERDGRLQKYASILEEHLPNAKTTYISKAGHQLPLKHHEAVNDIISDLVFTINHKPVYISL